MKSFLTLYVQILWRATYRFKFAFSPIFVELNHKISISYKPTTIDKDDKRYLFLRNGLEIDLSFNFSSRFRCRRGG